MTADDARYSVELLDALNDLAEVRDGLKDSNWLEFVALEGDRQGGTHNGAAYFPLRLAPPILEFVESKIRSELERLGVEPVSLHHRAEP